MIWIMAIYFFCMVMQIMIARYAYRIYKILNHGNNWWILCAGFVMMAIRSALRLLLNETMSTMVNNPIFLINNLILPVIISLLLYFGMRRMLNAAIITVEAENYAKTRLVKIKKIQHRMDRYETKKIAEVLTA